MDLSDPGPAVDLPRSASHVRAGGRRGGERRDVARVAAYGRLPDGTEDPELPLTDVQFVLGHALLTTTQLYLSPRKQDVIRRILAHHAQQSAKAAERAAPPPAPGYRPETLQVLFGGTR